MFVNSFLHIFGWAIVIELDENNKVISSYPARVKFRGFDEANVSKAYINLSKFMEENASDLKKEAEE